MKSNEEAIAELERSLQVDSTDFELGHREPSAPPCSNPYAPPPQGPFASPQQGPYAPPSQESYATPFQGPYAPTPQGPYAPPPTGSYEPTAPGPYAPPAPGPYPPSLRIPYAPPPPYSSLQPDGKEMNKVDEEMPSAVEKKKEELSNACRICSAVSYVLSLICAVIVIIFVILVLSNSRNAALIIVLILAAVFLGVVAIFCYSESCCSRERSYLENLDDAVAIEQRLMTLRNTAPNISIHAVAYHYETRTRNVHYTDSQGHSRTRTESYQQKVVTGTFNEVFVYNNWKDESESTIIDNISPNRVTRIKMDLIVKFGDAETQAAFNQQYDRFKEQYRHRDRHVDFSEVKTVEGFESHLAACMDPSQRPWWITQHCYCIASLFCCTWPYRMMFNRATAKMNYTLVKSVQCLRVPAAFPFVAPGFINTPYQQ